MAITTTAEIASPWTALSRRARARRRYGRGAIYAFLLVVSVPLMIPYLGLFVFAFSSDDPTVLWRAIAVLAPAGLALWAWSGWARNQRQALAGSVVIAVAAVIGLALLIGAELHLRNFDFLLVPPRSSQPSVWRAFGNSLILAVSQTVIVATTASLAGYYLSRFAFPARTAMLRALILVHAFPVITLIVPLFLMLHVANLLNSLVGVILVLVAFELPFAIFIMKGFFDAVPWDIEMSALIDGATRRQAFVRIVLPQVTGGIIAVSIFAFIRGWEEYIFVLTFLVTRGKWVMSLYLFFENNSAAVAVFYLLPPMLLFVFAQKYLLRISIGGMQP